MTPEEGNEEDVSRPGRPLPPDDRLWRHPSELGGGTPPPTSWTPAPGASEPRRPLAIAALLSACLAGAVVAVGIMWIARPTRVVHEARSVRTTQAPATASFSRASLATGKLASSVGPSLVQVQVGRNDRWTTGTGVWLDDHGAVLVATPLLGGDPGNSVTVSRAPSGSPVAAQVVGSDPATGISVLRVAGAEGEPLAMHAADPEVGDAVAVIGATKATGEAAQGQQAAVTAAIGTVRDRVTVPPLVLHDALLLDRQVPADAVGALVMDEHGHVVGVVVVASDADGLAVVAPADAAFAAATDLRDDGRVHRAWLGVRAADLSPAAARLLDLAGGARLTQVTPGSPAAAAGLRPDDVVTSVDGHRILDASDLVTALRRWTPGERVQLAWQRGTVEMTADATLGG